MSAAPSRSRSRSGITLIELLAAISVLGLAAAIGGLAIAAWSRPAPRSRWEDALALARLRAIDDGVPVRILLARTDTSPGAVGADRGQLLAVTALPDGRVIAPAELPIDPLTGRTDGHAR